jgi:DNA polymerase-3 subunit delta'
MIYPWLEKPLELFVQQGRELPHGMLLTGPTGLGKFSLAREVARSLLCGHTKNLPGCNECQGCQLFNAGNHPDYHLLTNQQMLEFGDAVSVAPGVRYLPEAGGRRTTPKRVIGIDQVRSLTEELRSSSYYGVGKVVVIYPADKLNLNAANALLKVLEEPTPDTHFLLVTDVLYALPATIRSRCSFFRVALPSEPVALSWLQEELHLDTTESKKLLQFAGGSPRRAAEFFNDGSWTIGSTLASDLDAIVRGEIAPMSLSKKWSQTDIRTIIRWLQQQLVNAFRAGVRGEAEIEEEDASRRMYAHLGREKCLSLYEQTGAFLRWPEKSVDEILFLESIVLELFE